MSRDTNECSIFGTERKKVNGVAIRFIANKKWKNIFTSKGFPPAVIHIPIAGYTSCSSDKVTAKVFSYV